MLTTVGPSGREDLVSFLAAGQFGADEQLVSRALKFLSVIVKMGSHREMFASPETLTAFCEKIILPNMGMRGKQSLPTMLMNRKRRGAVRGRSNRVHQERSGAFCWYVCCPVLNPIC
jgi:hypothetical protein